MSPAKASTQTASSGVERTKIEVTIPPMYTHVLRSSSQKNMHVHKITMCTSREGKMYQGVLQVSMLLYLECTHFQVVLIPCK